MLNRNKKNKQKKKVPQQNQIQKHLKMIKQIKPKPSDKRK